MVQQLHEATVSAPSEEFKKAFPNVSIYGGERSALVEQRLLESGIPFSEVTAVQFSRALLAAVEETVKSFTAAPRRITSGRTHGKIGFDGPIPENAR